MADCAEAIVSDEYEDFLIEYFGDLSYLENIYTGDCFQVISERFAVAYTKQRSMETLNPGSSYIIPQCYGLMSSLEMLESTGVARVQRRPALGFYGQRVMIGFIDTGDGVCI